MNPESGQGDSFRGELRRSIRSELRSIPIHERRLSLEAVADGLPTTDGPLRILCYLADGIEVDVDPVIHELLDRGAEVTVPAVLPEVGRMQAVRIRSLDDSDLETDRYGIRVPREPWSTIDPEELDAVLVPGVAFTVDGDRLGRGGGYYDRLLAETPERVRRIGICHRVQIVESLPVRPHDVRMHDLVIIEEA
ncbi:MAG: 5-formyltetrahydrofolate cyclo-ligase [Phycisphaerae bacterium]|nr:5-formyltetrahydrofolate cyclo-ligase [Phycisphaerae bacterium]